MIIDLRQKGTPQPTREEFLNENNVYVGYKCGIVGMQESELDADVPIDFPSSSTLVIEDVEETYYINEFDEETGEFTEVEHIRIVSQPKLDVNGNTILRQLTWREYCSNHVYQSKSTNLWAMECGVRDSNGNRTLGGINEDEFIAYSTLFSRDRIVTLQSILEDRVIDESVEI